MSLAARLGWTDRRGYVPAAFALTAFALGVQIALVTEALGPQAYPPQGKTGLAWGSGIVLALSALLHVPWRTALGKAREALSGPEIPRRAVHLAPRRHEEGFVEAGTHNGHVEGVEADLKARVHSPLSAGPVVAPEEEIPVTIEAEPEELARELDVTITVDGPDGSRTTRHRMQGTQLEHTLAFAEPGEFTVRIELDHPSAQPVAKTLTGRVASYREEVARLFERLKEQAARAGLDVTAGSTPREVCREVRGVSQADPAELADLAVELEVALYGDDEVERSTYETVYTAISSTGLLEERQEARR